MNKFLNVMAVLVAAVFFSTACTASTPKDPIPQTTPVVITFDPGGSIVDFINKYEDYAKSRTPVVVKGECISACTLMLGVLNPAQVCVSPNAMFAFHSATNGVGGDFSEVGTQVGWYLYPTWVRVLLTKLGLGPNIEHPELVWLPGTTFYRLCPRNY